MAALLTGGNYMSRLAMLYALEDSEVEKLRSMPMEERYTYMLNEIEEKLFDTPRGCELNKAWEAIQYCLGGGKWNDENEIPTNIIFGGEFLVDEDDDVITLKTRSDIEEIVAYLHQNNLQELIKKNFWNIEDENFQYKDDNDELDFALGWSEGIFAFYENALKENYQVIFTVDF